MSGTYELFTEIRRMMNDFGETPAGKLSMAVTALNERIAAIEERLEAGEKQESEQPE